MDDFVTAHGTAAGEKDGAASRFARGFSAGMFDDDNNDNNNDNNNEDMAAGGHGNTAGGMSGAGVDGDADSHADFDSEIYKNPELLAGRERSQNRDEQYADWHDTNDNDGPAGRISSRKPQWYGTKKFGGLHYMRDIEITGRLIVVEGPDASGRSTQIEMLTAQLEAEGYAVLNTGLTRSEIIGQGILEAKRNVSLGVRTLAMFYAADFADQLEHKIIPALQAGYVVLADRYIYTLMARNTVRGIKRSWSSNLYSFALVPDMTFYLDVDPYVLVHRVFAKRHSLDYYESGADMGISQDMYESFIRYQQRLAKEFEVLKQKYDLNIVDGNRSVEDLNSRLRKQVLRYLSKVS